MLYYRQGDYLESSSIITACRLQDLPSWRVHFQDENNFCVTFTEEVGANACSLQVGHQQHSKAIITLPESS